MTPKKAYRPGSKMASPRQRKGPILMVRNGVVGLEFACGHFSPKSLSGIPGTRVRDVLAQIAPCPICYPKGARFHQELVGFTTIPESA